MAPILESKSFESMPRWAVVAFIARCGRRVLPLYQRNVYEPLPQRVAVVQAIELAERRASEGGDFDSWNALKISDQYVDNYDIDGLQTALYGYWEAAANTHADVKMAETEAILAITTIAQAALTAAFGSTRWMKCDPSRLASEATDWEVFAEAIARDGVKRDFQTLSDRASVENWDDLTPIPKHVFGALWPFGMPENYPPMEMSFRPRARIIRTVGDRLISGPEAAVIELIKNSHDADASFVRVSFYPPLDRGEGRIEIVDDGHGMTLDDIEQKWMEPATSDKRDRKLSPKGRRLLGSKGIGRFASAKLGRFLEMESTARFDQNSERLESTCVSGIDWNLFDEREYLEEVRFQVEPLAPREATGTILKVSALRDSWKKPQLSQLHEELRRLISPVHYGKGDVPFRIFLDLTRCTPDISGFDGAELVNGSSIREPNSSVAREPNEVVPFPILDACDYAVDGVFDERGRFDGTMTIRRADLEAESVALDVPLQADAGEESCGIVLVRLYVFDREADAVRRTAEKAGFGGISVREARTLLNSISGVAIYREGFRIRPYGDEENDWLTLDAQRVQNPTIKIGRNQIAGIITVDGEHSSKLVERSSREGLEENGAFKRLQSLISSLLAEVVEPRRRQFRVGAGLEDRNHASFQDVYRQVQLGWSKVLLAKIPEVDRSAAEELVSRESDRLTSYIKRLEQRQAALEAKVTAGLIVGEVMHQGNTPLSFIETESARLGRWWPSLLSDTNEAAEDRVRVPRILAGLASSSQKLRALFDALSPLSGARRGVPRTFDPADVVDKTMFLFRSRMEKARVAYEFFPDLSGRRVVGYPEDLATAVTNLVDNALHWLEYHGVEAPRISVSVRSDGDACILRVTDNGRGVPGEFADQIFDVGFTLKPNGTGLGLSIAQEAMSRSNGKLRLIEGNGGAVFEIVMSYEGAGAPSGNGLE